MFRLLKWPLIAVALYFVASSLFTDGNKTLNEVSLKSARESLEQAGRKADQVADDVIEQAQENGDVRVQGEHYDLDIKLPNREEMKAAAADAAGRLADFFEQAEKDLSSYDPELGKQP